MIASESAIGASAGTCATCQHALERPYVCPSCGALQAAARADAFAFLGLPRAFDVDVEALRARYLDACRTLHPDRFGSSTEQLERSLRLTARANEAWQMLADPVRRAEYLLELSGGKSAAEDKTVPADVLSKTLMLREEIDEARASDDKAALSAIEKSVRADYESHTHQIAALARRLPGDEALRGDLRAKLNAAKYFQRLYEQFAA